MRNATDLRQKVLQASLALIEEGGLDRLSMREVARKSGVSHQAPYIISATVRPFSPPSREKASRRSDSPSCALSIELGPNRPRPLKL